MLFKAVVGQAMRYRVGWLMLASCASPAAAQAPARTAAVQAESTQPTAQGGANRAIVLAGGDRPYVVGTAELAGLEIYDPSGKRRASVPAGEAVSLDVRYSALPLSGAPSTVVAAADSSGNYLRFYRPDRGSLVEIGARPVPLGFAVEGVCLYQSVEDGSLYAFAVGDGGEIDQHLLFESAPGKVDARQVRRLHVPSTAEHCVADDRTGQLYVGEQAVGIWRFNAEPETEVVPALVDAVRLGRIKEEVGGLALFDGGAGAQYLIASNASAGELLIYDHAQDDTYLRAITLAGPQGPVGEPGGLFALSAAFGGYPNGALVVADEDAEGGSGDVTAQERVDLQAGCRLIGDVKASRLTIADGASFKGSVDMDV